MKKILVIIGNPVPESYSHALANSYISGAKEGNYSVDIIDVGKLNFSLSLKYGYKKRMEMEPDIEQSIEKIKNADHLVWIYPMWWYGAPALLKGFIDRTFLPGIVFEYDGGKLPKKLLKGKSSRIIITCDTPRWYDYLFMKSPAINQLKRGTLGFTGVKPVKVTYISPIKDNSKEKLAKYLDMVYALGKKGK